MTGPSPPKGDTGRAAKAEPDLVGIDFAGTDPDRTPAPRKTGPQVGTVADPFRHRTYTYESEAERTVITVLGSFPEVMRIEEQVEVTYSLDGVERIHFMDVLATYRGGKRVACYVKSEATEEVRREARAILTAICARHGARFADDYRLVTFDGLSPATVANAGLITRCGGEFDGEARRAVRAVLPDLGPEVTAHEVGLATGLGVRAMRAAFALIPEGDLLNPPGLQLCFHTSLANLRSRRPANQAA
ncbi:hypothetical protein ACLBXO_11975 [Methylobacterium sp. C33D]